MTDFKIADGLVDVVEYGDEYVATVKDLHFINAPADADLAEIKVWGAGGGGGGGGENGVANGGPGGGGGFRWVRNVPVIPGEALLVVVGDGGPGGLSYTGAGESGDGGAGAGRSYVSKFPAVTEILCEAGGGGGGGGAGHGALSSKEAGGTGGPGGGDEGGPGADLVGPWADPATPGLGGGQLAGGAGGESPQVGNSGDDGLEFSGGDGGVIPTSSGDGDNADGGDYFGGQGGAYENPSGGGGGGGGGRYGGGGGATGTSVGSNPSEPGSGGGGGSGWNVPEATLIASDQGTGSSGGGKADFEYPGSFVGDGGLGGSGPDDGALGSIGAVIIRFGTLTTVQSRNDIVIESDAPVMVEGVDQIAQQVRSILLTCQGEWFLDLAAGTPWFQRVLGHKFNPGQINITVREAILSVDGVAEIRDLTSVRGSEVRSASVTVTVLTTQGAEVIIEAEVP